MAVAVCGTVFGILLDKLIYLILLKMLGAAVPVGFYISGSAIAKSLILTGAIFMLMLLNSIRLIHKARPVELLRSDSAGEREPKAKWALALLGVILLGAGYYIAVTVKNPITAFMLFFAAVVLVIAGTYLLFTAGSIALLKLLRKNKNYYYRTKALYQYLVDALQDETKRGRPCEHLHTFHYGAGNGFRNLCSCTSDRMKSLQDTLPCRVRDNVHRSDDPGAQRRYDSHHCWTMRSARNGLEPEKTRVYIPVIFSLNCVL